MDFVQKEKPGKEKTKKKKDKKRKTTKNMLQNLNIKMLKLEKIDESYAEGVIRQQLLYQFYENMYFSDNMIMKKKIKKQEKRKII